MENTQLEATWWDQGFGSSDPFAWQKIIAQAVGKTWTDPPAPDSSVVDPYMNKKIFGIDKNGPTIQEVAVQNGEIIITVTDEDSVVDKVDLWINGSVYAMATANGYRTQGVTLPSNAGTPTNINGIWAANFNGPLTDNVPLAPSKEAWIFAVAPDVISNNLSLMPPCNPQTYFYEISRNVFSALWENQTLNNSAVKMVDQPHFWFSLAVTSNIQADGICHFVSILHPSNFDLTLDTPWQTLNGGKTAIFKTNVPPSLMTGDFLFIVGWDVNGNRSEPFHKHME
jgi:hypothetical protein